MKFEKSCGAIIVRKNDDTFETLLIKMVKGHWSFPKGHVENDETEVETALREIKEETNLDIREYQVLTATDEFQKDRHYVTIGVLALSCEGTLKVMEPNKIDKWEWFELNNLPNNLYTPTKNMINEYLRKESSA